MREIRSTGMPEAGFEETVRNLCDTSELGCPLKNDILVYRLKKFPFGIIYKIYKSELLIVAVAHHSRKPGYWEDRLHT